MKARTFSILRHLSHGEFRSGENIARALGISRASVSQALAELDQYGIRLFRLAGRGYRLAEPLEWLDPSHIRRELGSKAERIELEIAGVAESSNTALLQKAALGAPQGSCLAVELQTRGKGRRGRTWHGSLGGSLTFSLLWRFPQGAGFLSGLSLAVGVALMRALEELGIAGTQLKWPNDILHQGRKLAGILIELQGDMLGPSAAVIGIGINLKLPEAARDLIDQAHTDLTSIHSGLPGRNRILALVLGHLTDVLEEFEHLGFANLREEWSRHHAYHGKPVRMLMPDGSSRHGTVSGIAEDGALLVDGERFTAGEISLRGEP